MPIQLLQGIVKKTRVIPFPELCVLLNEIGNFIFHEYDCIERNNETIHLIKLYFQLNKRTCTYSRAHACKYVLCMYINILFWQCLT